MVGTELLSLLPCYTTRCVNRRIHKDSTNPGHHLLKLLSWVRWFRAMPSYTNRLKKLLPKSCWSQFSSVQFYLFTYSVVMSIIFNHILTFFKCTHILSTSKSAHHFTLSITILLLTLSLFSDFILVLLFTLMHYVRLV